MSHFTMGGALDDIEFLVRSANRVRALDALASGAYDRRELQERTEIPRATVGRIVTDFERRGWATQRDGRYEATPIGTLLAAELTSLLASVDTGYELGELVGWLPIECFDFGIERFVDARLTLPNHVDSIAPVRRAVELLYRADRARVLTQAYAPEAIRAHWHATVQDGRTFELVLTADVVEAICASPETATMFAEIVEIGAGSVYRYDGDCPHVMGVYDGATAIGVTDDDGFPRALIETRDDVVRSWADETIDAYRRSSDMLDVGALTV